MKLNANTLQTRLNKAGGILALGQNIAPQEKFTKVYAEASMDRHGLERGYVIVTLFVVGEYPRRAFVNINSPRPQIKLPFTKAAKITGLKKEAIVEGILNLWKTFVHCLDTGKEFPTSRPVGKITIKGEDFWLGLRRLPKGDKIGVRGKENMKLQNPTLPRWTIKSLGKDHTLVRYPAK